MEAFRGIKCSSFWDALVLRLMLEEHGVRVHVPDQGVVLSMVASGELDGIRAAVEQLGSEFPRSGSVIIEGEDRDRSAENGRATALSYDIAEEARATHRAQPQEATRPPAGTAQRQDAAWQPDDADTAEFAAITAQLAEEAPVAEPAQSQAEPRRCSASTAKGRRCRLIAQPGSATCAVHSKHALSAARPADAQPQLATRGVQSR